MKYVWTILGAAALLGLAMLDSPPAVAQTSAAQMLEQARARSRDMEELKAVLNGPDQNMRLATFDVMVGSGDEAMRQIALETGLASADPLLQSMAFKETILSLDRLILSLELDESQPAEVQTKAKAVLASKGNSYELPITQADRANGAFTTKNRATGQVTGTTLTFTMGYDKGQLNMVDETTVRGPVTVYQGGNGGFIATARFR